MNLYSFIISFYFIHFRFIFYLKELISVFTIHPSFSQFTTALVLSHHHCRSHHQESKYAYYIVSLSGMHAFMSGRMYSYLKCASFVLLRASIPIIFIIMFLHKVTTNDNLLKNLKMESSRSFYIKNWMMMTAHQKYIVYS